MKSIYLELIDLEDNGNGKYYKKKKALNLFPLFMQHADTEQLDYNWEKIKQGDTCIVTLKMHGTSQRTAYLPKENTGLRKLLRLPKKYDYVTGTRRVVLDKIEETTLGGFYGDDSFRKQWHDFFKGKLIKGEEVFYEVVGYMGIDKPIMGDGNNKKTNDKEFIKMYGDTTRFSYGCENGECKAYVYRMTYTDNNGYTIEYPWHLVQRRCEEMGIDTVPELEKFVFTTEKVALHKIVKHLDIPDPIGKTHVAEGIVLRLDNRIIFEAYKKKGFYFKVLEGLIKDEATEPDIEEAQEIETGDNE